MLLHHPPLLSSALCSTIDPSLNHFTRFNNNPNLNCLTRRSSSSPIYIFEKTTQRVVGRCASSSNSEQEQDTEERSREEDADEDESFQVVSAIRSSYNDIVIIDTADSRLLLLDQTHNVHSIFYKGKHGYWTNSYWDEFAALPPIIPPGPIAIFGLGGGTAAHLLLDSYPQLEIEGWEIDGVLVDKSRDYLGLADLETVNAEGGVLKVCVGDALTELACEGGMTYAGIVVDLFSGGKVLEEMQDEEFWVKMKGRLRPGGRVMVNCGGAENVLADAASGLNDGGDEWVVNLTVQAMWEVFKAELCWKKMPKMEGANYMAVTGEMPDFEAWEGSVPEKLRTKVWGWMPFPNVPLKLSKKFNVY